MKFSENELKVMNLIWELTCNDKDKSIKAIDLSKRLTKKYGWPKTSNYAYFSRLVKKGAIERIEPDYKIVSKISKEEIALSQNKNILNKFLDGSFINLFSAYLKEENISEKELEEMKKIIDSYED